jgi:hypothetical protein
MTWPPDKDPVSGRFLPSPGPKVRVEKHGIEYYLRTGRLPSVRGRRALARSLREFETDLRSSLGEDLTPQRETLMRQVLRCENVLRLIELYLVRGSPMSPYKLRKGKLELQPVLAQSYGHFLNVQRMALLALGLDRKGEEALDLGKYIASKDAEKRTAAAKNRVRLTSAGRSRSEKRARSGSEDAGQAETQGGDEPGRGEKPMGAGQGQEENGRE